jgi:hypothetical protein
VDEVFNRSAAYRPRQNWSPPICNPVWLATLDELDLSVEVTAAGVLALLGDRYSIPADARLAGIAGELQGEVEGTLEALRRMKKILQSGLEKLRRNPKHLIPQPQLTQLTELERQILEMQSSAALRAFVGYFETALAMVEGDNTRRYLESYLRPVMLLEKQLICFNRLLSACLRIAFHAPG